MIIGKRSKIFVNFVGATRKSDDKMSFNDFRRTIKLCNITEQSLMEEWLGGSVWKLFQFSTVKAFIHSNCGGFDDVNRKSSCKTFLYSIYRGLENTEKEIRHRDMLRRKSVGSACRKQHDVIGSSVSWETKGVRRFPMRRLKDSIWWHLLFYVIA